MSNLIFKHDIVDNLDSDLSDKPLSARMGKYLYKLAKKKPKRYSEKEQWTGEYWIDGRKIYTMTIPEFIARGTQDIVINSLKTEEIQDIWIDFQNSYCCMTGDGGWNYRSLINTSPSASWLIESLIMKTSPHPTFRITLGSSYSRENYIKVMVRYTKK